MCFHPIERVFPPSVHDRLIGLASNRVIQLPCGKCADCLRKRQNDLQIRCYNEAKYRGSAVFVTLTYSPENVPVARSLWFADPHTGEFNCFAKPELVSDFRRLPEYRVLNDYQIKEDVSSVLVGSCPAQVLRGRFIRYSIDNAGAPVLLDYNEKLTEADKKLKEDFDSLKGKSFDWYIQYTPTLYYEDVKLALKRFRRKYKLPEFTYVCCGEYGANPKSTQRPHYHLVFFGLQRNDVLKFAAEWKYGFTNVQQVMFVNKDGSDGLARVSRYIGKYCAKGVVDIYNPNKDCVLRNRLRSSKHLGCNFPSHILDWFLAKDVCGEYDIDDPYRTIPSDKLQLVVNTIADRLNFQINGYSYSIPQSFKRFLFKYRYTESKGFQRPAGFEGKHVEISEKAIYAPLWYLVADVLRSRAEEVCDKQFRELLVHASSEDFLQAVDNFNNLQETITEAREKATSENLLKFYLKSKV